MIITKLKGGLGNQLFQYAAGRRLANKINVELKLDISTYTLKTENELRNYELHNFNINENFVTKEDLMRITGNESSFYDKIYNKLILKPKGKAIKYEKEKSFEFDLNILSLDDNVYLDGYWQSDEYFKDAEETIRKDFTLISPIKDSNKKIAELIEKTNSISMHIRRGDYIENPSVNQVHGVCDLEYYKKALDQLTNITGNSTVFLFSDDPEWVQKNIKLKQETKIIQGNDNESAYEDLHLMSLCKHNIIANSSFSWWGAWLNNNKSKIVIAPKKWFNNERLNTKNLLPKDWIQI